MILLIWSSERAQDCAKAVEQAFQQPVRIVSSLEQASEELMAGTFSAVLLDQWACETTPAKADFVFQHLGGAVPVTVNFAISAVDRVVRAVRTALEHRNRETHLARQNACAILRAELKDDVTALLLSCGIALQEPTLTETAAERVKMIEEVANQIRRKLLASEGDQASCAAHA
jgi:hypothetical protein